jgi:hypothetical protein
LGIAERYGYHIFDGLLIAAAQEAGCETLYTEDMQDGQRIGGGDPESVREAVIRGVEGGSGQTAVWSAAGGGAARR